MDERERNITPYHMQTDTSKKESALSHSCLYLHSLVLHALADSLSLSLSLSLSRLEREVHGSMAVINLKFNTCPCSAK